MRTLRPCRDGDFPEILAIINAAAHAYRGVIPDDRWHEPYMPADELAAQIRGGVQFWGCEQEGNLVGVMGIQAVRDVHLIRHAYVRPGLQRGGVGAALLRHLSARDAGRLLVGTWADATWAIDFYQRNGFVRVAPEPARELLRSYWSIPDRQVETSVVLELPRRRRP